MSRRKRFKAILLFSFFPWFLMTGPLFGHEEGAPFSGAIPEPIIVHHAHIEDEQRLNFAVLGGFWIRS